MRKLVFAALLLVSARVGWADDRPVPEIRRVLIVSIDGLRPDVLLRAATPNLHHLYETGAFTFWAKTTAQSVTLPSHVSMLTGVTPEAHGIQWNADLPFKEPVYPAFPTIFELARQAHLTTGLTAGKHKFIVFDKPGVLDWEYISSPPSMQSGTAAAVDPNADADVAEHAAKIIVEHKPDVMFVHLPNVDNWGHFKGWGSPEQLAAAAEADRCVGVVLTADATAGLTDSTLIIVTADHGGAGRTHGPDDPRSRTIPWILHGPRVRQNLDLTRLGGDHDITTYDTFATACKVLALHWPATDPVVGKYVGEAFDSGELMLSTYEPKMAPTTNPSTGP